MEYMLGLGEVLVILMLIMNVFGLIIIVTLIAPDEYTSTIDKIIRIILMGVIVFILIPAIIIAGLSGFGVINLN